MNCSKILIKCHFKTLKNWTVIKILNLSNSITWQLYCTYESISIPPTELSQQWSFPNCVRRMWMEEQLKNTQNKSKQKNCNCLWPVSSHWLASEKSVFTMSLLLTSAEWTADWKVNLGPKRVQKSTWLSFDFFSFEP